jgi:endogenous inhibitor of DNA gyrase (YacG/DUF329 family)
MSADRDEPGSALRCPRCGRAVPLAPGQRPAEFPFCSRRCRLGDLGAWLDGRHAVPGRPLGDEDA